MLRLAVGHSVSAVPLQGPFCHHHPFLSQVSQPPPLFLLPTIRLLRRAGMPPVHPATSPSEDSQAPVPAGFSPRSSSQGPCACWVCPCAAQRSPCKCLSLGPCTWRVCPCAPRRSSGRSLLSQSDFGHTDPNTLCPAFNRAFPCQRPCLSFNLRPLQGSRFLGSPSVCTPARSPAAHPVWSRGSCNFSSTAAMGFQSIAVDHVPAKPWHVLQLDLREPGAQQLLLSTLRCLLPALVVLAPPCGTAFRGRDIPAYSNAMGNARSVRASIHTVCFHFKAMTWLE